VGFFCSDVRKCEISAAAARIMLFDVASATSDQMILQVTSAAISASASDQNASDQKKQSEDISQNRWRSR